MCRLEVVRGVAFQRDERLKKEIRAVVRASFVDEENRLESEFEHCDTIYLMRDHRDEMVSLFMVAWETLEIEGEHLPALFMSVSVTRTDHKNTGKMSPLYKQCIVESQQWELRHGQKLIAWATTMTPIVYRAALKLFSNTQPYEGGTYTDSAERIARAIGRRIGVIRAIGDHPFVLPGLIPGVRFREEERLRIRAVCEAEKLPSLDRFGIDETKGDRLLIVTEIPPAPLTVV